MSNTVIVNGREYEKWSAPVQENPIRGRHDFKTTRETIKRLLANGVPNWVKWPQDYKAFAKEQIAAEKEVSDTMASAYKMPDQEILTDKKARLVNIMHGRDFIKKLRDNGIKCFTFDNGMPSTVGLWAAKPGTNEVVYICFMQVPYMPEWSVIRTDSHGVPWGEEYRGWRTVLSQLILKEILTEDQAHKIFGKPALNRISRIYRRTLWNFRNRNKK
jgi:hypothetical protein